MERRKRNKKECASSAEEQSEICISSWCSPFDFFLDLSLVFSQLQILLSTLEGEKTQNLPSWFYRSSKFLQAEWGKALFSPFLWFCKDGVSVWAIKIRGAQFTVHALRTL